MTLSLMANMIVCFLDPVEILASEEIGAALLICGALIFVYVLLYLRSAFFGDTEPKLDFLITKGPYRFCRHPLYLSFLIMIFGIDLLHRSVIGVVFTLTASIASAAYRARTEDRLLRSKFHEEWDDYADEVGFFFPRFRRQGKIHGQMLAGVQFGTTQSELICGQLEHA